MKTTNSILSYIITGGLFLIPFIAFIVPETYFFPFIAGKGFAFRILVEVLFGLYVILALIDNSYRPKLSWISKAVLFFTVVVFVADIFGENAYKSIWSNYERMEGFVLIGHLFLYYIVASSFFRSASDWFRYFNVSLGASVLMSFFAISQLIGISAINQGGERVDATFGNASYFAVYLLINIFISLYMLFGQARKTWHKWAYGSVALLEVIILYFTATRGAILGLIGGVIITGLIIAFKEKESQFLKKIAYGMLAIVVLILLVFTAIKNTEYAKNSKVLSRFTTLSVSEIKNQGRYYVWPMAVKGFVERPILGWGQENFNFVFNKYYNPGLYGQEEWFDRTHDVFLDWLIAGGILGLLSYMSMYVALLYYVWRRSSQMSVVEKAIFTGMISGYVFHNIFVFDNLISYILFFSLLAYVHSVNTGVKNESSIFYTKTFSRDMLVWAATPLVLLSTCLVIYFVNIPALTVNTTLIKALQPQKEGVEKNLAMFKEIFNTNSFGSTEALEQLVQVTIQVSNGQFPEKIKQDFYNLSKLKLEEKLQEVPNDARYLVFAGSFFNRFGRYDEAIKYLERALVESPKKQSIYYELGAAYLGKGDRAKVLELFKTAYELKRSSESARVMYVIGAIYAKNDKLLNEILPQISTDTIISDDRLLRAYAEAGKIETVISILNSRIQKDPKNLQNRLSLASTYASIGQKQNAIKVLQDAIAFDPAFKTQGEIYIKEVSGM